MSKAFTSEENEAPALAVRLRPRGPEGEPRYVTPEGFRGLQATLEKLKQAREEAAAQGTIGSAHAQDLDEQIQALSATLDELTVVVPDPAQAGRAFFGAWVTLEDEEGQKVRYRIVGADEVDPKAGLISSASPLARELLGKEQGDNVTVVRPRGPADYTVVAVEY